MTYRRVLGLPGALRFSMSGLVARLPIAMMSLGIVLLVTSRTDSYTAAGGVSAAFLVANAVAAVPQARLVDALGQSRVLPVATALHLTGLAALMTTVQVGVEGVWPYGCAAVAGASMPQIGSCVRARWTNLVADKALLQTAFAFEAVVDETVFIVGPTLVTVLATSVHPLAGLGASGLATLVGTGWFLAQRSTEPPAGRTSATPVSYPMPWRTLAPLAGSAVFMGMLLGGTEVATVAFCDEHGHKAVSGLLLALWALGSLLAGLVTGARELRMPPAVRFRRGLLALALLMLPLPFVHGFALLGVFLFLSGTAISPTLIASLAWVEQVVPSGRITEGITVFITGLAIGLAPGAAVVGRVVDAAGAAHSFWVTVAAGLLGAAFAFGTGAGPRRRATDPLSPEAPAPSGSSG